MFLLDGVKLKEEKTDKESNVKSSDQIKKEEDDAQRMFN